MFFCTFPVLLLCSLGEIRSRIWRWNDVVIQRSHLEASPEENSCRVQRRTWEEHDKHAFNKFFFSDGIRGNMQLHMKGDFFLYFFFFEKSKEQVAGFQELLNNPRIYWMRFSDWGWSAFNYFQISFLLDENEKWMRTDDYKTSPQFFPVFVSASKPTPLFPLQTLM